MKNNTAYFSAAEPPAILTTRPYRPIDAWRITEIFYNSVHGIDGRYYSIQELNAWAPLPIDYAQWAQRLNAHSVQVAEADGELVGFTAMEPEGYIDWLYVHSEFQRLGVASLLYDHLEQQAYSLGLLQLTVHASHLAKPFFERKGFRTVKPARVQRQGVVLHNWKMEKTLLNSASRN